MAFSSHCAFLYRRVSFSVASGYSIQDSLTCGTRRLLLSVIQISVSVQPYLLSCQIRQRIGEAEVSFERERGHYVDCAPVLNNIVQRGCNKGGHIARHNNDRLRLYTVDERSGSGWVLLNSSASIICIIISSFFYTEHLNIISEVARTIGAPVDDNQFTTSIPLGT